MGETNRHSPLISVLMPVYNCGSYIDEAVQSILNQTFTNFEFLILDDASTDDTWERLQKFTDSRIKLFRNEINMGHHDLAHNSNYLIDQARGEFITRMDGDDVCSPELLKVELGLMQDENVVAAGVFYVRTDESGNVQGEYRHPIDPHEIKEGLALACNVMLHGGGTFRKNALQAIGGYRTRVSLADDYDMLLRLAEVGEFANAPQFLYSYRQHPGGTGRSNQMRQQQGALLARVCDIERKCFGHDSLNQYSETELDKIFSGSMPVPKIPRWQAALVMRVLADRLRRAGLYSLSLRALGKALILQPWNLNTLRSSIGLVLAPATYKRPIRRLRNLLRARLRLLFR